MISNPQASKINKETKQIAIISLILILWSLAMFWLCFASGLRHDYRVYLQQWQLLLDGGQPWLAKNAYGPMHTVIGYLLNFGQLIPKFFIVGTTLVANALLVRELIRERGISKINLVYLFAVPLNVLFIGVGVIYGLNDVFIAALIVFAVHFRLRKNFFVTGALIGIAALTKFYPLVLLPFFALDKRRLNLSVIASGMAVFFVGMAGAVAIWGRGPIDAVLFSTSREPELLSVFAALLNIFGYKGLVASLIVRNTEIMIFGVIVSFVYSWWGKLSWLEGGVLGYLVMLTIYQVGHQQFYVPFLFMLACLPLINTKSADRMAITFLPIAVFLSFFQLGYEFYSDQYQSNLRWVRDYGGFLSFLISISSIASICFYYLKINLVEIKKKIKDKNSVLVEDQPDKSNP